MPAASGIKTLIVDDQQSMRSLIRTSLHALGINNTKEVGDGEDALRFMLTAPVHLVITDFNMPKLDGLGLLRAIRAHPDLQLQLVVGASALLDRYGTEVITRAVLLEREPGPDVPRLPD